MDQRQLPKSVGRNMEHSQLALIRIDLIKIKHIFRCMLENRNREEYYLAIRQLLKDPPNRTPVQQLRLLNMQTRAMRIPVPNLFQRQQNMRRQNNQKVTKKKKLYLTVKQKI